MKLSEIKGKRVLTVMSQLVVPIANIAMDKEASELFTKKPLPAGMTVAEFMMERAKASIPALIDNHTDDLITIMALLDDMTPEEYEEQLTALTLIEDVINILTDPIFSQLFTSAQTKEAGESSGSVQENTEAAV